MSAYEALEQALAAALAAGLDRDEIETCVREFLDEQEES